MIWFTSDTHFFHEKILTAGAGRPFLGLEEMHETLIDNWNNTIAKNDIIYFLGDLSLGKTKPTTELIKRLNGKKHWILGNHDSPNTEQKNSFEFVKDYYVLKYENHRYVLFHYPIFSWEGKDKAYIHLHGHCHGENNSRSDRLYYDNLKFDVGVDNNNFFPISIVTIENKIKERAEKYFAEISGYSENEKGL